MKKLLSLLLALVLLASMSFSALAEPFYLESAGITIEVPEGMTGEDASSDAYAALRISVNDNPNLTYAYLVSYSEELEGRSMEDLTDEEGNSILADIAKVLNNPSFSGIEVNGVKVLVAADEAGTELHYISILGGWVCDVAAVKTDGEALTDDEVNAAAQLLVSIEFDEYDEGAGAEEEVEEVEEVEEEE